jgi:hypothetical protein
MVTSVGFGKDIVVGRGSARPVPQSDVEVSVSVLLALWSRSFVFAALQALASRDARAGVTAGDSARAAKDARNAQASFEILRRWNLPWGSARPPAGCDGTIGRICYWSDESDDVSHAPPESPQIAEGRQRLIEALDRFHRDAPSDSWIVGQLVRYLSEAGRNDDAVAAARSCASDRAWCAELTGYALHVQGNFGAAESAFHDALAAMPNEERCRWEDIRLLVDDDVSDRLEKLGCAGRDTLAARVWWLATPFYLIGANDVRTEHFARMVRARMEERARSTMGLSWGDDLREVLIRYGWDIWYNREQTSMAYSAQPTIAGHPPWPSFDFFASREATDHMTAARPDDWSLRDRQARARYAPAYVKALRPIPHQLSVFRRGDSALVIASFDLRGDTAFDKTPLVAGLFLTDGPDRLWGKADTLEMRNAALETRAPWTPLLASVEVISSDHKGAARARYGVVFPGSDSGAHAGRVSVSDMLLFAGGGPSPRQLDSAVARALTTTRVPARAPLGLFWEMYGVKPEGEKLSIALTIQETGTAFLRRAARVLHLADKGSPLSVQWQEVPDRATGIASRAVTVDLARLTPGRYRIRLTVTPNDAPPTFATREIEIVK